MLNVEDEVRISSVLNKMELKEIRNSKKLTQIQLAEQAGISVSCVLNIETDKGGYPRLDSLMKYLDVLGYELCFRKKTI